MIQKLDYLKDRLSDLSKRNRSIRLMKLADKWAVDLTELEFVYQDKNQNSSLLDDIIKNKKNEISLFKRDINDEKKMLLSHKLTSLHRNLKGIEEETGMYDLYLGYPFLTGKMMDGTFFRAPVFLYPIKLEKNGLTWNLVKGEGEKLINRTLFLALKKLNEFNIEEKMLDEDYFSNVTSIQELHEWFKEFDYNFPIKNTILQKFQNYTLKDIPKLNDGEIALESLAVIGCFPQGNSAVIKDYDLMKSILEENGDLGFISELLFEEENIINDSLLSPIVEEVEKNIDERDKVFLLPTDGSQEEILQLARNQKGLVVHGPPGTGKSQVIVNLITDAINQKKKVLVVCQKRAALDVVNQRLDGLGLSKFAALVHDEKNDRQKLYSKIQQLINVPIQLNDSNQKDFEVVSSQLRMSEGQLNDISNALFEVQDFGYRAYDLYSISKPKDEMKRLVNVKPYLNKLSKYNLEDILAEVYTYGEYYERFGNENYPWKQRKSFKVLELKDQSKMTDTLNDLIESAKITVSKLDEFEQNFVTPEYAKLVQEKIEKIYEDLDDSKKRSFKNIRLWIWTSFTGKNIIEELLEGNKFKGTSSKEWIRLKQWLKTLYDLSKETENFMSKLKNLIPYVAEDWITSMEKLVNDGKIPLNELEIMHEYIFSDFEELRRMDRFYHDKDDTVISLIELAIKEVPFVETNLAKEWVDSLKDSTYLHWIDEIERKHPIIEAISTEQFNRIRDKLKNLIEQKRNTGRLMLQNKLLSSIEETKINFGKAIKELSHQTSKKRQLWPLRKLVREFSDKGLTELLPVWLLSPEVVSSILPLTEGLFDLVIFDEASQCTVENGLPSIYRGKTVVVAGDEMQLPPSNLFQGSMEVDEDDETMGEIEESKSLLNLSKRHFQESILQWHYRSKSEELINFSNYAFYNSNIQIAPNVEPLKQPAAITWKKIDGLWINQSNLIEAQFVVSELKKQIITYPKLSVGIITFNAKQQEKILDEIEKLAETDKEFEVIYNQIQSRDLDERIFVKNIENVQGDERDVIIFSIGYAKGENGRVYNRFGTLSQSGGENRLNVAVSRAKEKILVVSSIEPNELDVSNSKNRGPKLLKAYLEYAKATSENNRDLVTSTLKDVQEGSNTMVTPHALHFDSGFEVQVYDMLVELGYEVHTQVGLSGYRIDLAIVDPNDPSKYLLGIECDGAMYHSSPSAKERDVYRQKFLEDRGWKIERIWSRNWWKNRSGEIERIEHVIKDLIKKQKVAELIR
ncbi:AAA domain-containing protein [Bacillus sp. AFS088145]|uniref:AAA domain-containing protein n=1 Tax=Bacillus sp. AFS088145 TaxID=2033514 RepID=UPI000BF9FA24|nr:AAA domain-containing protein [Bacillus sp. AFS088145]PFH90626.1 helicase [Bacillus sp. AFS088145]